MNYMVWGSEDKWVAFRVYRYIRFVWKFPWLFLSLFVICSLSRALVPFALRRESSRYASLSMRLRSMVSTNPWKQCYIWLWVVRLLGRWSQQMVSLQWKAALDGWMDWFTYLFFCLFIELCGLAHSQGCFLFLVLTYTRLLFRLHPLLHSN